MVSSRPKISIKFIINSVMHQQGCQNTSTLKTSLLLVMLVAQLSD